MKKILVMLTMILLVILSISASEVTTPADTHGVFLEQGLKSPFAGWLIREGRIKELLTIEMNYSLLAFDVQVYLQLKDLAVKKLALLQQDIKDIETQVDLEKDKNIALQKQVEAMKKMNAIWITTSVVCIGIVIVSIGVIVCYAVLDNYFRSRGY